MWCDDVNHIQRDFAEALRSNAENKKLVELKAFHINEVVMEEEYLDNHYMQPH